MQIIIDAKPKKTLLGSKKCKEMNKVFWKEINIYNGRR